VNASATLLERLGLARDSEEFARLASDGDALFDAWRSPTARANDLAWLASRIVADPEHRTVLALAFLGAAGSRVEVKELEQAIAFVTADLLDPDDQTMAQTALLASRAMERAVKLGFARIKDDNSIECRTEDGLPYVIVWLVLHCVLIICQAGCPLKSADWARHTFRVVEQLPGADQVAEFLREVIPFEDFETAWFEVITSNAAKA